MAASIRPFDSLGLPGALQQFLLTDKTRGLILIAGEMVVDKTSTAASLLAWPHMADSRSPSKTHRKRNSMHTLLQHVFPGRILSRATEPVHIHKH